MLKNKSLELITVHHSPDMDGIASGVITESYFNKLFGSFPYEYAAHMEYKASVSFDYYDDESKLKSLINSEKKTIMLFIDVTPSIKFLQECANNHDLKIIIFDHHVGKLQDIMVDVYGQNRASITEQSEKIINNGGLFEFHSKHAWIIAGNTCAAKVFYDYVTNIDFISKLYSIFNTMELFQIPITVEVPKSTKKLPAHYLFNTVARRVNVWVNIEFKPACESLVDMVNMYDVWLWEDVVKYNKKQISGSDNYNLYKLYTGQDLITNGDINYAINAYAWNYYANRLGKVLREYELLDVNMLYNAISVVSDNIWPTDVVEKLNGNQIDIDRPTNLLKRLVDKYFATETKQDIFPIWIKEGIKHYVVDYENVQAFFSNPVNMNQYVKHVKYDGYSYVIVNYEFSNVIRDYFTNELNGEGQAYDFIIFTRLTNNRQNVKLTGRCLYNGAFPMDRLMKDKFDGGGHPNAGGGTIDIGKSEKDYVNMINSFIDNLNQDVYGAN